MTASNSNNCPENKHSSNAKHDRKLRKPLIEKRRRERINCSLEQLKGIMVDAYNLDQSKLEKADVLEVTVQHMEGLQKGLGTASVDNNSTGFESRQRYSTGYIQCMHEVHNLLLSCPGMDKTLGAGLLNHLLKSLPHVSADLTTATTCCSPGSSPERASSGHPTAPNDVWSSPNNNNGHYRSFSSSSSSSSSPPTSPLSPETRSPFRPRRLEMHGGSAPLLLRPSSVSSNNNGGGCFLTPPRRASTPASPAAVLAPPAVEDPSMWRPW